MELLTIVSFLAVAFILLGWYDIVVPVLHKYGILIIISLSALYYFDCEPCKQIIFIALATAIFTAMYLSPKHKY
jgi:hypothetical protein